MLNFVLPCHLLDGFDYEASAHCSNLSLKRSYQIFGNKLLQMPVDRPDCSEVVLLQAQDAGHDGLG